MGLKIVYELQLKEDGLRPYSKNSVIQFVLT
jgi:hypothetical protein